MNKRILLTLIGMFLAFSPSAAAHEKRAVGPYEWTVGYVNEPAFSGQMNGIDLRVTKNGEAVLDLEKTLKVTVNRADAKEGMPLELKKRHKDPGRYAGYFLPSKPGDYIFHFTGQAETLTVDESFTPHEIQDAEALRFPKN